MSDRLDQIIDGVKQTHRRRRMDPKTLRAFEGAWRSFVKERFPRAAPESWTKRAVGQSRDLIERYGREHAMAMVEHAVASWGMLRRTADWLPQTPTFGAFYAIRDRVAADLAAELARADRKREQRQQAAAGPAPRPKREPEAAPRPEPADPRRAEIERLDRLIGISPPGPLRMQWERERRALLAAEKEGLDESS